MVVSMFSVRLLKPIPRLEGRLWCQLGVSESGQAYQAARQRRYPPLFFYQTCSRPSSVSRPSLDARGFAVWHPSCVSHGSLRKQFEEGGKHVGTEQGSGPSFDRGVC